MRAWTNVVGTGAKNGIWMHACAHTRGSVPIRCSLGTNGRRHIGHAGVGSGALMEPLHVPIARLLHPQPLRRLRRDVCGTDRAIGLGGRPWPSRDGRRVDIGSGTGHICTGTASARSVGGSRRQLQLALRALHTTHRAGHTGKAWLVSCKPIGGINVRVAHTRRHAQACAGAQTQTDTRTHARTHA
jgi:hypothetical protein